MKKAGLKWVAGGLLLLLVGLGVLISVIGITPVEKYVTAMVLPAGIMWLVLLGLGIVALARKQCLLSLLAFSGWAFFAFVSSGLGSGILVRSLEAPFVGVRPLEQPPFDAVIVLGGGASQGWNGRFQGNDRLVLAAQLYHQKVARKLICTGSQIRAFSSVAAEPREMSTQILIGLGVPEDAIERVEGRNTSEEMANLAAKFQGADVRLGVVTSAWHLKRALRLAKKRGLEVKPLPSDFLAGDVGGVSLAGWVREFQPDAEMLFDSSRAIKEYLGMAVGR